MAKKKNKLLFEQFRLFQQLDNYILKCREELRQQHTIALNLGCSEWREDELLSYLAPVKMFPDLAAMANKNFDALMEENSRKRYYLIKAFMPILKELKMDISGEHLDCYAYWEKKLK